MAEMNAKLPFEFDSKQVSEPKGSVFSLVSLQKKYEALWLDIH